MNAAKPFDEMHAADGTIRTHYQPYSDWLGHTPRELIARKRKEADLAFHRVGITFNVYGADGGKAGAHGEGKGDRPVNVNAH